MYRLRLPHILLCVLISSFFAASKTAAQAGNAGAQALSARYQKWLDEDVRYIINDQERADFLNLASDKRRNDFVVHFWELRNPDRASPRNAFKEEHYRRLAYTNQHFAADMPGWRTDRGRIYILYGPPDRVDHYFSDAGSQRATDLYSVATIPYDWELWHYEYIEGIGMDVTLRFVDTCGCGRYQMPITKEDLNKYRPR